MISTLLYWKDHHRRTAIAENEHSVKQTSRDSKDSILQCSYSDQSLSPLNSFGNIHRIHRNEFIPQEMSVRFRFQKTTKKHGTRSNLDFGIRDFFLRQPTGNMNIQDANAAPSVFLHIWKAFRTQIGGLTKDFKSNGLPWSGPQCRSILAGGSGILFLLPAFFCKGNTFEQARWVVSAFLSFMADYVCIVGDSWFHGIDRVVATTNAITLIFQAATQLQAFTAFTAIIPISTFIMADRAKQQGNLESWKYYHFLWHVTASLNIAFAVYLFYHCPEYTQDSSTDSFVMNRFCHESS